MYLFRRAHEPGVRAQRPLRSMHADRQGMHAERHQVSQLLGAALHAWSEDGVDQTTIEGKVLLTHAAHRRAE